MATLTLKGMSDEAYERLKARAEANHRSLNREAVRILEEAVASDNGQALLGQLDAFHDRLRARGVWVLPEQVERWINEGRQ